MQTPKNSGVAASIPSTPYSIGYIELSYAIQNKFTYAAVKNAAGDYVVPSLATVAADADQKTGGHADRLLDREPARRHQLPDRRLQLGHPAAEADERHDGRPGGEGPRLDDPHRWRPGPGGAGLDYVALPPAVQNQDRTQLLTVTGPSGQTLLTK